MPRYDVECQECFRVDEKVVRFADFDNPIKCTCGGLMKKLIGIPAVINTRDSFGIGKEFLDKGTGKVIDNWGKWEKAGFRDPMDSATLNNDCKNIVKAKRKAIKDGKNRSIHLEDI